MLTWNDNRKTPFFLAGEAGPFCFRGEASALSEVKDRTGPFLSAKTLTGRIVIAASVRNPLRKILGGKLGRSVVREGKGAEDRITMLPESLKAPLQDHLKKVRTICAKDLAEGWGRVQMPSALDRKYPNAGADWRWQWAFPQENRWINARTKEQGRHHVDQSLGQKAVREAVVRAGLTKRATCHTLGYSLATHLLESGYDIRTVQELLGHNDVKTTMIYTHVLNRGPVNVRSPADEL